jgi:hypothetical protein
MEVEAGIRLRKGVFRLLLIAAALWCCGRPAELYSSPVVRAERSLFWSDGALLDDASLVSFPLLMAAAAGDRNGGALLQQWFHRFATTEHSQRTHPGLFVDAFAAAHGGDPSGWDLSLMAFKLTGLHNRIDLAELGPGGHCGELRASFSCTALELQPFHVLFVFRQPAGPGDLDAEGHLTCTATARRWAELSRLEGEALLDAVRFELKSGFAPERFAAIETLELTVTPWEWRQWVKGPAEPPLQFTLQNPPLFQQLDVERLNLEGPRRDDLLHWVEGNAAALDARTLVFPERLRAQSVQVSQKVPRVPLSLEGLRADVAAQYPNLRQHIELLGCAACHTADADFVQTRTDRSVSPFHQKELSARERHLEQLADGIAVPLPFGPLQPEPVLP